MSKATVRGMKDSVYLWRRAQNKQLSDRPGVLSHIAGSGLFEAGDAEQGELDFIA